MSPTLEQIAKLAGVSRSTVSRVVNNQANVRADVRSRVLAVIHDQHYQPHQAARSLVTRRTQAIGLIIPEAVSLLFKDAYFQMLIQGIAEVCNQQDYYLTLILCTSTSDRNRLYERALHSGHLDGVILASVHVTDPLVPLIVDSQVPAVLVGRHPYYPHIPYVDVDNRGSSRDMVAYLLGLGHRRVATISGPQQAIAGMDRLEGYRMALREAGIPYDPTLVAEGDFSEESGTRAMQSLLPAEPTCVFAASDAMAVGAIKALNRAGLSVPARVAVAGFDDLPFAALIEPALTTVRQSPVEMGQQAAQMLIALLNDPASAPRAQILSTELVRRQSTGPLRTERQRYEVAY